MYLGLFEEGADAAKAYDRALVRLRGAQGATNYGLSDYREQLGEYHHMAMVGRVTGGGLI